MESQIKENQKKIKELGIQIDVMAGKELSSEVSGKLKELEDRLQFKLMKLEIEGQEHKISTMQKALVELKKSSSIIK